MISFNDFFLAKILGYIIKGKTVALVGNSSELHENQYGPLIDSHDVVIRMNYRSIEGEALHLGTKTTIRFIGCTLTDEYMHFVDKFENDTLIITTDKNRDILRLKKRKILFYKKRIPWKALKIIKANCEINIPDKSISKPPRTGIVCLSILLKAKKYKKLTLFGMATEVQSALGYISNEGKPSSYNLENLLNCHGDIALEIEIIQNLVHQKLIAVY